LPSGRDPRITQKCAHKPGPSHNSPTRRFMRHQFRTRVSRHPPRACRSRRQRVPNTTINDAPRSRA
jgi:hypothetical protein